MVLGPRTLSLDSTPGSDRRTLVARSDPAFPVVCYLTAEHPTHALCKYGSAVLISEQFALTAAHNVFDPEVFGSTQKGYARALKVTPGFSVAEPSLGQTQAGRRLVCHPRFVGDGDISHDIALLFFHHPFRHVSRFPTLHGYKESTEAKVRVLGYPAAKIPFAMYEHASPTKALRETRLFYTADASQGQSGGGVFDGDAEAPTLVALHTYGYSRTPPEFGQANSGTALTEELVSWVKQEMELLKGG